MAIEGKPSSAEEKYRILLEVSEAANAPLDFVGVLAAVARVRVHALDTRGHVADELT